MRLIHSIALLALGLPVVASAEPDPPKTPTDINIGVIFPRNETYNLDLNTMPVVLAIQGAYAAFYFRHSIRWEINGINATGGTQNTYEAGYMSAYGGNELPPDAIGDTWIAANTSYLNSRTQSKPGPYRLTWELGMSRCRSGTGNNYIIDSGTVVKGSIDFTITDQGDLSSIDLTSACPVYSNGVTITGTTTTGCPFVSRKDGTDGPDMCASTPDKTLAGCVMTNITRSADRSACDALLEEARRQAGSRPTGSSGSTQGPAGAARRLLQNAFAATAVTAAVVGFMLI